MDRFYKKYFVVYFVFMVCIGILGGQTNEGGVNYLYQELRLKDVNLANRQRQILDSFLQNSTYKEVRIVLCIDSKKLLEAQELTFLDLQGSKYTFKRQEVKFHNNKYYIWYGAAQNHNGDITLIIDNTLITGTIQTDRQLYQIEPLGETYHVLALVNNNAFCEPNSGGLGSFGRISDTQETAHDISRDGKNMTVIRILFAYTDDVAAVHNNIKAMIQTAVTESNQSFSNSGANVRVETAHTVQVSYNETGCAENDLNWFIGNTYIRDLRSQYYADVCMLIVDNSDEFGRAKDINASSSFSFAIVRDDAVMGRYTPAHELGHLIGARHNIEHDPTSGPYDANHGFIEPVFPQDASWMTIMGVNDKKYNPNGLRLKQWSRPGIYGNAENANVVNVLNSYAGRVANFYPDPPVELSVSINGPDYLDFNETGHFYANASGGSGSYVDFKWWNRNDNIAKGSKAPPPGEWIYMSQWEGCEAITCNPGFDFSLKCEVVDSENNTAIDVHSVRINERKLSKQEPNIETNENLTPGEITLQGNYPNPFNPSTTIRFHLPEPGKVSLTVFSVNGVKVVSLMDGIISEGFHQVVWNGCDKSGMRMPSGIYVYSLCTKNRSFVQKMLLEK